MADFGHGRPCAETDLEAQAEDAGASPAGEGAREPHEIRSGEEHVRGELAARGQRCRVLRARVSPELRRDADGCGVAHLEDGCDLHARAAKRNTDARGMFRGWPAGLTAECCQLRCAHDDHATGPGAACDGPRTRVVVRDAEDIGERGAQVGHASLQIHVLGNRPVAAHGRHVIVRAMAVLERKRKPGLPQEHGQ
jgi:hypothetical protein